MSASSTLTAYSMQQTPPPFFTKKIACTEEGSSDCLGHLAQMHATALNSEWTLKEILNILVEM